MATTTRKPSAAGYDRPYPDFHDHLAALEDAGLLRVIDTEVNKDTQLHPLVRWQFRGGIPEDRRTAFKFTNVVDSKGRKYDMPVVVSALSTNTRMYAIGMGVPVEEIGDRWNHAIANPVAPRTVEDAQIRNASDCGRDRDIAISSVQKDLRCQLQNHFIKSLCARLHGLEHLGTYKKDQVQVA